MLFLGLNIVNDQGSTFIWATLVKVRCLCFSDLYPNSSPRTNWNVPISSTQSGLYGDWSKRVTRGDTRLPIGRLLPRMFR